MGNACELSPELTPWTTNTPWLKAFLSSARNLAPDYTTTFSISHPDDNGVLTIGTRDGTVKILARRPCDAPPDVPLEVALTVAGDELRCAVAGTRGGDGDGR